MFLAREFTFAGVSSSMYGLYLCDFGDNKHSDVSFGNKAKIIEERIAGRVQPLHFGVNYHEEPLEFTLIFGGDRPIDRYDMQAIARWLTGHQQYQWLTIDEPDMTSLHFRCLIKELTPISVAWYQYGFSAEVICDCPYAYSDPFEQKFTTDSLESDVLVRNFGSARESIRPIITIENDLLYSINIKNNTTKQSLQVKFDNVVSNAKVTIDNQTGILTATSDGSSIDIYPYFNFEYIELAPCDNDISIWIPLGDGTITFSGRYLHNVGA